MTIWKFPLKISGGGLQVVAMPEGAEIISLQMQGDVPTLWAWVNPKSPMNTRAFVMYGTGWGIGDHPGKYIGTVQHEGFVWHYFEVIS